MEVHRLDELRLAIDQIDRDMISLLAKRFQLTEEVGMYKAVNRLGAQDLSREADQFDKIKTLARSQELNPEYAASIYRCLMDQVISRHKEIEKSYVQNNQV